MGTGTAVKPPPKPLRLSMREVLVPRLIEMLEKAPVPAKYAAAKRRQLDTT
jgi:hypothetical protein